MSTTLHRRYGRARVAGLTEAVHAMRVYLGGIDYASVAGQQKLYARATRAVDRVVKATGLSRGNAWSQIEAEARRQGAIRPVPGQHL